MSGKKTTFSGCGTKHDRVTGKVLTDVIGNRNSGNLSATKSTTIPFLVLAGFTRMIEGHINTIWK